MKRKSIGKNFSMCVQPVFIIGTYNTDGSENFATITWVSSTCVNEDEYYLVLSMFGAKRTKENIRRTKQLSVNLASTDMLELVDYFGNVSGKKEMSQIFSKCDFINAPNLSQFDPVIYSGQYHSIGKLLGKIGDFSIS